MTRMYLAEAEHALLLTMQSCSPHPRTRGRMQSHSCAPPSRLFVFLHPGPVTFSYAGIPCDIPDLTFSLPSPVLARRVSESSRSHLVHTLREVTG